ncbi:MAG: exostosin family protein, partial [Patescibacteria group bacterium]
GVCGWTEYKNFKNRAGTLARNAWVTARSTLTRRPETLAETKGITLRRRALAALERSGAVRPHVMRRGSYSGHASTITLDPARARREYVDNMLQSDFSLVVKGDGNYSYRFYETLSLGRVPLFLNTACRLPIADAIDYGAFVVFAELAQIDRLAEIAAERYRRFTPEEFLPMQRRAREVFEKYLRVDSFFRYAVGHLL